MGKFGWGDPNAFFSKDVVGGESEKFEIYWDGALVKMRKILSMGLYFFQTLVKFFTATTRPESYRDRIKGQRFLVKH